MWRSSFIGLVMDRLQFDVIELSEQEKCVSPFRDDDLLPVCTNENRKPHPLSNTNTFSA